MKFEIRNRYTGEVQFVAEIEDNANLRGTNLRDADLRDADLIVIYLPIWTVYITKKYTRIGCQNHTHEDWFEFSDDIINCMDDDVLAWWRIHKPIIRAGVNIVQAKDNH